MKKIKGFPGNPQSIEDVQKFLDSYPEEATMFSAYFMVRSAYNVLLKEHSPEQAKYIMQLIFDEALEELPEKLKPMRFRLGE